MPKEIAWIWCLVGTRLYELLVPATQEAMVVAIATGPDTLRAYQMRANAMRFIQN